jgi:hypothetical protein
MDRVTGISDIVRLQLQNNSPYLSDDPSCGGIILSIGSKSYIKY